MTPTMAENRLEKVGLSYLKLFNKFSLDHVSKNQPMCHERGSSNITSDPVSSLIGFLFSKARTATRSRHTCGREAASP